MSKENVEILKKLFDAGARGDVAAVRNYIASDVAWTEAVTQELPFWSKGSYKGIDAVLKDVIGPCIELFDNFRLEAEEFLEIGDRVISIGKFRGKAKNTGKELDSPFAMVSTLKDGKIVKHRNTCDTAAWLRALGLELGKRANLPLKQPVASAPH